jgi:xanthine/uracil permease
MIRSELVGDLQLLVCAWYQVAVSFVPTRALRRIFPPVVTGTCLVLLGTSLLGSGFQNWGGGSYCASQVKYEFLALGDQNLICI